jgi:hypothetical protein
MNRDRLLNLRRATGLDKSRRVSDSLEEPENQSGDIAPHSKWPARLEWGLLPVLECGAGLPHCFRAGHGLDAPPEPKPSAPIHAHAAGILRLLQLLRLLRLFDIPGRVFGYPGPPPYENPLFLAARRWRAETMGPLARE